MSQECRRWSWLFGWVVMAWFGSLTVTGFTAENPDAGPYVRGGLGISVANDSDVTDFLGGMSEGDLRFEPGPAVSVGIGYNFNRFLAVEFETGFLLNGIDRLGRSPFYGDAALYQTPVMGNALFQVRNSSGLVPFLGAGAGGSAQIFVADHVRIGEAYLDGVDSDFVFAWQVFGGLKYEFNQRMAVGVSYRYRDTDAPSWDVSDWFGHLRVAFDRITTHVVTAEFHYRF